MSLRRSVLATCLAVAWAGLCGFSTQPLPPGLLADHADAPVWGLLKNATHFTVDDKRGLYIAAFDKSLTAAEHQSFTVSGYILPVESGSRFRHFIVTRRSTGCPFCPPNAVGEAVEVFAAAPLRYTPAQVTVTGRLTLVGSSAEGLFYRLDQAAVS